MNVETIRGEPPSRGVPVRRMLAASGLLVMLVACGTVEDAFSPPAKQTDGTGSASGSASDSTSDPTSGASGSPSPTASGAPVTVDPIDGTASVSRSAVPVMTFNQDIAAYSVSSATVSLTSAQGNQPATLTTAGKTVTVTPDHVLFPLTQYTLTATVAVNSATGPVLDSDFVSTFTTADGQWAAPTGLDGTLAPATPPKFVTDPDGEAVVVWGQGASPANVLNFRRSTASGWSNAGPVDPASTGGDLAPLIAIDGRGQTTVAWLRVDASATTWSVFTSSLARGGSTWSTPTSIASRPAAPRLALNADAAGNVMLAIADPNGLIVYSQAAGAPGWTPTPVDPFANTTRTADPRLAIGANGNLAVGWVADNQVRVSLSADAGVTWVSTAAPINQANAAGPTALWADYEPVSGNPVFVWSEATLGDPTTHVYANVFDAGLPGVATRVDPSPARNASRPDASIDPKGNILLAWAQQGASTTGVASSYRPQGGAWSSVLALPGSVLDSGSTPRILLDAGGNGLAIWGQSETWGSGNVTHHAYASRLIGRTWGSAAPFDDIGAQNGAYTSSGVAAISQLGRDAFGSVLATWLQASDGGNATGYVARWR